MARKISVNLDDASWERFAVVARGLAAAHPDAFGEHAQSRDGFHQGLVAKHLILIGLGAVDDVERQGAELARVNPGEYARREGPHPVHDPGRVVRHLLSLALTGALSAPVTTLPCFLGGGLPFWREYICRKIAAPYGARQAAAFGEIDASELALLLDLEEASEQRVDIERAIAWLGTLDPEHVFRLGRARKLFLIAEFQREKPDRSPAADGYLGDAGNSDMIGGPVPLFQIQATLKAKLVELRILQDPEVMPKLSETQDKPE